MTTLLRLRALAVGVAVSSALLAGSCGNAKQPVTAAPAAPSSPQASATAGGGLTEDQRERMALIPPARVPWDKAAVTAVGEVPKGRLVEIELEASRGTPAGAASGSPSPAGSAPPAGMPVWDVTVVAEDGTAHDVQVDAVTGKVTRSRVEPGQDEDDKSEVDEQLKAATTTAQQAVKTATDRKPGTVAAVELDDDVWSVDIVTPDWNKTTYDIDAAKGTVVREHVDSD
ncbi:MULTISPECIES: PepSY domain-containing protein [unclassified Streptomyces]|uniref:PepSY domain-containing protein n=1 Tax=unclassified Streptomyces TaxID=2593676 RepID=UPI0029A4E9B8|nr:PepSY domain-containing protein [Streptomyces sp. DK15]MDX2389289.1 PepSY domain-containing protein [Streptomyces sp. DK15]